MFSHTCIHAYCTGKGAFSSFVIPLELSIAELITVRASLTQWKELCSSVSSWTFIGQQESISLYGYRVEEISCRQINLTTNKYRHLLVTSAKTKNIKQPSFACSINYWNVISNYCSIHLLHCSLYLNSQPKNKIMINNWIVYNNRGSLLLCMSYLYICYICISCS